MTDRPRVARLRPPGLTFAERRYLDDLDQWKLALELERRPNQAPNRTRPIHGLGNAYHWWDGAVRTVEGHGGWMKEEVLNSLMHRDGLEELMTSVPKPVATRLREWIGPLDDRYRAATVDGGGAGWRPKADDGWWWRRWPRDLPASW